MDSRRANGDGVRNARRAAERRLWLASICLLVAALVGLAIFFVPTLEFTALDLLDRVHLMNAAMLAFAFWAEAALLVVSVASVAILSVRAIWRRG